LNGKAITRDNGPRKDQTPEVLAGPASSLSEVRQRHRRQLVASHLMAP
jgi:hypothetical protein